MIIPVRLWYPISSVPQCLSFLVLWTPAMPAMPAISAGSVTYYYLEMYTRTHSYPVHPFVVPALV
jgi:hypothetical protein